MADSTRDMIPGFGAAVRTRRESAGLSLEQLAARVGTHFTAISKVERSQRSPSLRLAAALASALGVSLDVLMMDAARSGASAEPKEPPAQKSRRKQ